MVDIFYRIFYILEEYVNNNTNDWEKHMSKSRENWIRRKSNTIGFKKLKESILNKPRYL